jgi:4-amino-4-deoxy-L-arabinose transferase-like glycosyltransferase
MLLLLVSFILLFLIFQLTSHLRPHPWGWRASLMMAGLAWGCVVTLLTELLSLDQNLNSLNLTIGWGIVLLILLGLLVWLVRKAGITFPDPAQLRKGLKKWMHEQDLMTWVMVSVFGIQAILLAIVALAYAPNTYESMTYHLPRVMHWLQNGSLENIASTNVRDVYFPPFAEFVFLHGFALAGGDHYLNLFQWDTFLLCIIGVSAVAAELGAPRSTQIAAAVLGAGIPMAVLQATTARNDLVVSAWLVSLIWFGLRWSREPASWLWATLTGLSLGLAVLTKATSFIYALPLCILIGVLVIRNGGLRSGILRGGFVLLLTLLLNAGHFGRNLAFYMNPSAIHQRVGNDFMSPAVFVSNGIRNVAIHVPTDCKGPLTIMNQPGQWLLAGLERLHTATGLSPTDTGTTWGYVDIFDRSLGCIYDEHYAGNPLHMMLILGICLALPFLRSISPLTKWYSLALVSGFMLLNLTLRWQVWGSHLQVPLFVLWAPITVITLSHVRRLDLSRIAALLAVSLSFIWIYNNQMRPLSGLISGSMPMRDEQYFQSARGDYLDFHSMTNLIAETSCDSVGLNISSLVLEYPLWTMLREKGFDGEMEHIDVPNETSIFEDVTFVPCAIISEGANSRYAATMSEYTFGDFAVYLSEASGSSSSP